MSSARHMAAALLGVCLFASTSLALSHKVVSGDTLGKLSQRYGVTVEAIKAANGRTSDTIYLGEVLVIPVPATTPAVTAPTPSTSTPVEKRIRYRVGSGDSLWKIGLTYGITVRELKHLNGLSSNTINPGDVLTVIVRRVDAPTASQPTNTTGAAAARHVAAIVAAASEVEVLARIVKGETTPRTPYEGKVAVAAVVLNRVRSRGYPNSISGVAHQYLQFSCYNADSRQRLYYGKIPEAAWKAAREALAGSDPTGGATHYFNPYVVTPPWRHRFQFVRRIGHPIYKITTTHDFYRPKRRKVGGLAGAVQN